MPRLKKLPLYQVGWYGARLNMQEVCLVEQNGMKGMRGLRMMVSQGTHTDIVTVGRNGCDLRVTPTPLFILFLNFLGFLIPFRLFSPFLRALAPL